MVFRESLSSEILSFPGKGDSTIGYRDVLHEGNSFQAVIQKRTCYFPCLGENKSKNRSRMEQSSGILCESFGSSLLRECYQPSNPSHAELEYTSI